MIYDQCEKYGPQYMKPTGAIAQIGSSEYRHRFGGSSWGVIDQSPLFDGPTLLFVLDLRDPLLEGLKKKGLDELPLCTYASCGLWAWPQAYRIRPREREVVLTQRAEKLIDGHFPEFAGPLAEKGLSLLPMSAIDYPTSEEVYWQASDCFLGGTRFIRVLGPPLWMYAPVTVTCECGRAMDYVAALGHERVPGPSEFVDGGLFLGEGAIYWFLCPNCLALGVISQPS